MHDTANFSSSQFCCACGGGILKKFVDIVSSPNSAEHTCSDISQAIAYGFDGACSGTYDTIDFTVSQMCASCGGGQEMPRDTWYQTPGEGT